MTKNGKVLTAIAVTVALVAVAGGGYALWRGSDDSSAAKSLVILDNVQRQTLKDSVTLTGTLAREEQRKVTNVTLGRLSALYAKDGESAPAEARLFAIDGRDAITEPGDVPFFRTLSVGDRGDDVIQLKEILAESGFSPGPIDSVFTEQTRFALAQWQAANHYPGATPVSAQTATVSLAESTGYTLGKQSSAGLIIGPPPATPAAARSGNQSATANLMALHVGGGVTASAIPALTIQSTAATVTEGAPVTFVINASATDASPIDISISSSGASTADVVYPPSVVTLPANASSVQVVVPTRADNLVEGDENYTLTITAGGGYTLGSPVSATTKIIDANVPEVHISGGGSVSPGASRVLTVTADQAPVRDTQVSVTVAGDATPLVDYKSVNPTVVLRAGHKTAQLTIQTLATDSIHPDKHIIAALAPAAGYRVGSPGSAVVTLLGQTGNAALPIVTLRSATTHLTKGEPFSITISLSSATSSALTINLAYSGSAQQGTDYTLPGGSIVVPPGTTSLPVMVPTVADNKVESDRTLVVSVAASSHYRVGAPNSVTATIDSPVIPELTITANSTTVALGGAGTFTITADQAPVENTSVNFQVVGTAQPGQDYEPLLGTTVLLAGQKSVTVTLRSIRKDVVFQPTDMIVGHWPIRVGQVFVKEGDPLPPGTPILSLTDPSFTVTLQASASDRTKLEVGQTCTVKLTGGTKEVEGTISELDQNLTSLAASQPGGTGAQVYEGKINVADLGAADGASVSIEVTVQEKANVITVPIAAVKQNGSGHDVVRVIDLANRSHVTDVEVTTGLSEGSYIEVTKGLKGDETVIVEVDQPK